MSREEFIKALNTAATREFADVPDEDSIEWDFSESFLRKMQKLIRDCRRPYLRLVNTASKRAAAVAAVLLTLFAAGFGIKAVREPIVRIIKEAYRTFIGYSFEGDVEDEIVSFCYPQFIPEGFEQSDVLETETLLRVTFENDSNKIIRFEQKSTENFNFFLDDEHGKLYKENIGGTEVGLYTNGEVRIALWNKSGNYFYILTDAEMDEETFKRIIASVR